MPALLPLGVKPEKAILEDPPEEAGDGEGAGAAAFDAARLLLPGVDAAAAAAVVVVALGAAADELAATVEEAAAELELAVALGCHLEPRGRHVSMATPRPASDLVPLLRASRSSRDRGVATARSAGNTSV